MKADQRLKDFIDDNFDFYGLKKAGMFPKGTRKTDYEKIAARICEFLGYDNIYEYHRPIITHSTDTTIMGHSQPKIDKEGNYVPSEGFHIDMVQTEFACPICQCQQDATEHSSFNRGNSFSVKIKCKGCKRGLRLHTDMGGKLSVYESTS